MHRRREPAWRGRGKRLGVYVKEITIWRDRTQTRSCIAPHHGGMMRPK